jgi:hypothetical protein
MSEAAAPTKSNRPYWRAVLRSPNALAVAFAVAACAAIAYFNAKLLFVDFTLPKGDMASNDILVTQAKHFALFQGNYSRVSFYHPGPFYFQWMAIFEWLFVDVFRVFAAPQAAQFFSIAVLNVLAFALYLRLWLLWSGNLAIAGAALLITIAVPCAIIGQNYVVSLWPPHMYLASALLAATGLIGMATLGVSWLPLFIFGLAQLVHGHASFIGLAPIMMLTAAAVAWKDERLPDRIWRADKALAYVKARPGPFVLSAAIVLLFALPVAINTIVHWPGELPKYFRFAGRSSHNFIAAARYVLSFMPLMGIWAAVFLLPAGQSATRSRATDYRFVGILTLATAGVPALFYAMTGIDSLNERYLLYWMLPFVGAALATAILYFVSFLSFSWLRVGIVAAAAVGSLNAYRVLTPVYPDTRSTALTAAAADLLARRAVNGEKIALQLDHDPAGWPPAWSEAVAIIAATNRRHEDFLCVERSSWHLLFHEQYRCKLSDKISEILYIVAKGKTHGERIAKLADADIIPTRPPTVGTTIRPGNLDGLSAALLGDWSVAEPWGVWSDGNKASLSFDASLLPPRFVMSMWIRLFPDKPPPVQTVKVTDNEGRELAVLTNTAARQTVDARIEMAKPASPHMATLRFEIMYPVAPRDIGFTQDRRRLGIGLEQLGFEN